MNWIFVIFCYFRANVNSPKILFKKYYLTNPPYDIHRFRVCLIKAGNFLGQMLPLESVSPFYQLDVSDDGTNYSTKFARAKISKQTFSINKRYLAAMKYWNCGNYESKKMLNSLWENDGIFYECFHDNRWISDRN